MPCRHSQSFARFCHSSFSRQIRRAKKLDSRPVWPIPLPYHDGDAALSVRERSFHRAINMMVLALNWLHLGCPMRAPADFCCRATLSSEQMGIVQRLQRLTREWCDSGPVSAEDMGRAAGKVESLENTLQHLTVSAVKLASAGGSQRMGSEMKQAYRSSASSTLLGEVQLAKEVESKRLSFRGVPSFHPSPFLEAEAKKMYEEPLAKALAPEEALQGPPRVQVRGSHAEAMGLFKKLDASQRLTLLDPSKVRKGREAGLFALMKSVTADRMILDSRPANELEAGLTAWTSTMASIVPLLDLVLPRGTLAITAGEDLRDYYYYYYYYFVVSEQRSLRNAIKFKIPLQEARKLKAYAAAPPDLPEYVPGLQTMAMGDLNAVEIGQQSHVKLAMSTGVRFEDLLTLRGGLPRSGPYIGIVIDDFIVVECIPAELPEPGDLLSSRIADRMVETYEAVGLQSHDQKRFRAAPKAKFWGASLDGVAGTLRMQLEKTLPIAMITSQVARLGVANRKLLEVPCGSWVAILQCRRRAMCLLESAFTDIQDYDYGVTFMLSPATVDELWSLVILALRAEVCPELSLVDASGEWEAEVTTPLEPLLANELHRQKLSKAAWSRLLSPLKARQRLHKQLDPEMEVPDGEEPARNHPLWTTTVKSRQFTLQWRRRTRRRAHINVSELSAALRTKKMRRARKFPNRRLGSDSQVSLGALVKGRSASRSLNKLLRQALPTLLCYNVYTSMQYVPTAENVADDPTRNQVCR